MLFLKHADLTRDKIEILAIPVCEDKEIYEDKIISALVKEARKIKEFTGKKGDALTLYNLPRISSPRVLFWGLGKIEKIKPESLRALAGNLAKKCVRKNYKQLFIAAPSAAKLGIESSLLLEALFEGAFLGNHIFDKYIQKKEHKPLKRIYLCVDSNSARKFNKLPSRVEAICRGTLLAREWVSTPSNDKRPEIFARSIQTRARRENLKVRVLTEKELKQKKFGALLAVAAGSQSKPRMAILEYEPGGARRTIVFVGKGVTFDSGGINLKPSAGLNEMKSDMSGAAAVAATLLSIAKLKPKMKVVGVIPLVENMPSGSATRPGDIVRSYNGKTVEIGNTDAEGRLILIDALSYAIKTYKPDTIIDLATLTGACVVALGEKIAGLFSPDDKLCEAIIASGEKAHERCWRMPLPEDYKELLKSDFADINNLASTRWGGAITAALFMAEFVGKARWAHIDIAGPAYARKGSAYCNPGGTGFGVRLLCDLLEKL